MMKELEAIRKRCVSPAVEAGYGQTQGAIERVAAITWKNLNALPGGSLAVALKTDELQDQIAPKRSNRHERRQGKMTAMVES